MTTTGTIERQPRATLGTQYLEARLQLNDWIIHQLERAVRLLNFSMDHVAHQTLRLEAEQNHQAFRV